MLNFYNYYDKIHPELMKKIKELETKIMSGSADNNDTLIIRVALNDFKGDENKFAKGDTFFKKSFGAGDTIKLSEDQALCVLRDVKVIMIYHNYSCKLLYKIFSDVGLGIAHFGTEQDGITLENNTLTRLLPS